MPNVIAQEITENYSLYNGDSCEIIKGIPDNSIHYTIFSPPFASLYTYSNSDRDMGNCRNDSEFYEHFKFLASELYRVTMPGRLLSFHCMDLPRMKERDGVIGLKDFPAILRQVFEDCGFIYHSRVTIWKNPVTEMQRTKALGLLHKQIKKDSAMNRQGIPDYIITMRKPGDNPERISHTNETFPCDVWQQYASPVWMDIRQSDTLQKNSAREEKDERHICPLQLEVIQRCIELWTNPNDIVLEPFGGIGSVPYVARKLGRRAVACELKESYYRQMVANEFYKTEYGGSAISEEAFSVLAAKSSAYIDRVTMALADIRHLIYSYDVVKFTPELIVAYTGPDASIVINGYAAKSADTVVNDPTYSNLNFSLAKTTGLEYVPITYSVKLISATRTKNEDGSYKITYRTVTLRNGEEFGSELSTVGDSGLSCGFRLSYSAIYAPGEDPNFPNGYANVGIRLINKTEYRGETVIEAQGAFNNLVGFNSIVEYEAAVGLTRQSQPLDKVIQTVTVVPNEESSMPADELLQLAYAYTDNAVANHETSVELAHEGIYSSINTINQSLNANAANIAANTAQIADINDANNGILVSANKYTDETADQLREEFGGETTTS